MNKPLFSTFSKYILAALLISALTSCGNGEASKENDESAADSAKKVQSKKAVRLSIDTFSTFPPEIDGCACYLSATAADFEKKSYIYADNYQQSAFVRINGELVKFTLKEAKEVSEKHWIRTFTAKGLELIIDLTQVGQIDETWQQQGTLKLTSEDGTTLVRAIYGECGC